MEEKIPLIANKGYIYTNGKKIHGYVIYLGDGVCADDFKQIKQEEYDSIYNAPEEERATEEDYQNALKEMGVDV